MKKLKIKIKKAKLKESNGKKKSELE